MTRRWTGGVLAAALIYLAASGARACGPDIEVRFFEAADGDVFTIANRSEVPWTLVELEIRLDGSIGRLVFDTADGGPGFSMYRPFEAVDGEVELLSVPVVGDGAETVHLRFRGFQPGRRFLFVIDVDDRLEQSDFGQAVVSGAEITGAQARAELRMPGGATSSAKGWFGADARAVLRGGVCT